MRTKRVDILFSFLILFCFSTALKSQQVQLDSANAKIQPLSLNTDSDEFAPLIFNDTLLIYCSNTKNGFLPYYSEYTDQPLSNLVCSRLKNGNASAPARLLFSFHNQKTNLGPATLNFDGTEIYFTASGLTLPNIAARTQSTKPILKIYKATNINGEWTNFEEFPYNHKNASVGHPALSADGTTLIFASNMPGGSGGSDLYMCTLKNGKWTKPRNLGTKVNSRGNEYFPYLSKDNILYFSSDTHPGAGKLDLFYSGQVDSVWQKPRNMGYPFNSEHDDYRYIEEQSGFTGFFTSNRISGKDDDIFKFEKAKPDCDTLIKNPYCYTFYESGTLQGENLPLMYEWDFGDGAKKRGLRTTHCFDNPGFYYINLNIIDTITGKVYFNEASYVMEVKDIFKPHFSIEEGGDNMYTFNADKSKLPDCRIYEYIWDFGDGQKATGKEVRHIFQSGIYSVNLLVKGKTTDGSDCMACVRTQINSLPGYVASGVKADSAAPISNLAHTVHTIKGKQDIVFKVQVTTSDKPIPIDTVNFRNLSDVKEYKDNEQRYGYVVGEENYLAAAYPLYVDIREKGYEDARVVAFQNGKMVTDTDTAGLMQPGNTQVFTHISGRILNRYGEPLKAVINLENLTTGKVISKIVSDSITGRFHIILPNEEIYGYYAELTGYYSVSNYIDLRKESRNLEIKKNIEMISLEELDDENLSIRLNNLFFEPNQFKLQKESFPELTRLANVVFKKSQLKIEISGHTDNTGSPETNLILSQKRADAVKDFLIFLGINKNIIVSKGYGDTRPLVSNSTERGRYLNRRVEFRLFFD